MEINVSRMVAAIKRVYIECDECDLIDLVNGKHIGFIPANAINLRFYMKVPDSASGSLSVSAKHEQLLYIEYEIREELSNG